MEINSLSGVTYIVHFLLECFLRFVNRNGAAIVFVKLQKSLLDLSDLRIGQLEHTGLSHIHQNKLIGSTNLRDERSQVRQGSART
jgi:hypothetical protein